jgi:hypothetical protein
MVTAVLLSIGHFSPALSANEPVPANGERHPTMRVNVSINSYGFVPTDRDWSIDQPSPRAKAQIEMQPGTYRMPFGEHLPRWQGSKEIALKDGYRIKIFAVYMVGKPEGDFVRNENGLSINVSYYYDKQLIDFESATKWDSGQQLKVATSLRDIPYFDLLSQSGFEIPSEVGGYMEGFRFWVAVRDGLNRRDGNTSFETLSRFLKPLNRKNNLMIPHVRIECENANPSAAKPAQ